MMDYNVGTVYQLLGGISIGAVFSYFWISEESIAILTAFLVIDFLLWIIDQYIRDKNEITSSKMHKWLVKKITRWLLPFVVVAILRGAGIEDTSILIGSVMGILIIGEGYSIVGHIFSINTGEKLPEIDAFRMLIGIITEAVKKLLPKDKGEGE